MRDLKADLEQIQNFRSKWRQSTSPEEARKIGVAWEDFCQDKAELWLEQGISEAERAEKAEELARELVSVLEVISRKARGRCLCSSNGYCESCFPSKYAVNPLRKAKEVLGDE